MKTLGQMLSKSGIKLDDVTAHLNELNETERVRQVRELGKKEQVKPLA